MVGTVPAKTTISRLLRDLELSQRPATGSAHLTIDGKRIAAEDFPDTTSVIRVFNLEYIDANVHRSDGQNIPPILVLGEQSANRQRELRAKEQQLSQVLANLKRSDINHERSKSRISRHMTNTAREIKRELSLNSFTEYNFYNRTNYDSRTKTMVKANDHKSYRLTIEQRRSLKERFLSPRLAPVDTIISPRLTLPEHNEAIDRLLEQSVTNIVIEKLRNDEPIAKWIREGLSLHIDRDVTECLFCEQVLPKHRVNELSTHFNDAFNELTTDLKNEIDKLNVIVETLRNLKTPEKNLLYRDLHEEYDEKQLAFQIFREICVNDIQTNVKELEAKRRDMFASVMRQSAPIQFSKRAVLDLNDIVTNHNSVSRIHSAAVKNAAQALEAERVADNLPTLHKLSASVDQHRAESVRLRNEQLTLESNIAKLKTALIDHRRPAEEFNTALAAYIGHDELQLKTEETGYALVRPRRARLQHQ